MDRAITIWSLLMASFAVWRLASFLFRERFTDKDRNIGEPSLSGRQDNFFGSCILDCLCWLSVWLSAQTAIWVAGGLAGVLLNWFALSMISRAFAPSLETPEASNGDISCLTVKRTMQVHHA